MYAAQYWGNHKGLEIWQTWVQTPAPSPTIHVTVDGFITSSKSCTSILPPTVIGDPNNRMYIKHLVWCPTHSGLAITSTRDFLSLLYGRPLRSITIDIDFLLIDEETHKLNEYYWGCEARGLIILYRESENWDNHLAQPWFSNV